MNPSHERDNLLKFNEDLDLQDEHTFSKVYLEQPQNDQVKRKNNLKQILNENMLGCDLIICLFIAALQSYKAESCLRPFPQCFVNSDKEKEFATLRKACDTIPTLKEISTSPVNSCLKHVNDLLRWLFIEYPYPVLNLCSINEVPVLFNDQNGHIMPQFVFRVSNSPKVEETWQKRIKDREIFYAFHGSAIYNFYSILKFGLQQHFNYGKEVLFGNGIYLSNELSICINYAPFGETWKNSALGNKHSIIAVCEVINDLEKVKCQDNKNKQQSAVNSNSLGEIPKKYFVVTDSEMVKIKYLLVYRYETPFNKSFFIKNVSWIIILLYFIMLIAVGFFNSPNWPRLLKLLSLK